jgi:hypothetical protein
MSTGNFSMVLETNHAEYAALIRTQVPAKEQAETIASQMTNLIKHGDYSAATAYLDRIAATPAEREVSAMKSIQDMYPKNPASVDKVTVKALALAANGDHKIKFADAADLAVQYSAQNGSDEVLAGFLSSNAALRNKPIARDLAAKIADEARRAEVLHFLK